MHDILIKYLKLFFFIGGMPKAILTYIQEKNLNQVRNVQFDILESYKADFPKYGKRIDYSRVERIFKESAYHVGKKIIYQNFDKDSGAREIKKAIELLVDAMVLTPSIHSECSGIPIDSTLNHSIYKIFFLDIGLLNALHRLEYETLENNFIEEIITKGIMAEQFVAQHLQSFYSNRTTPELRYWLRDKGSSKAEIDFAIQYKHQIIPIEVKAAKGGKLKSLIVFAKEKKWKHAVVINSHAYKEYTLNAKSTYSQENESTLKHKINILNIPLYSIEALRKILDIV